MLNKQPLKLFSMCDGSIQEVWGMHYPSPVHASHSIAANSQWVEFQLSIMDNATRWWRNNLEVGHFNNSCDFPRLKFKFSGNKTSDYLRCIYFLREALQLWSDAWDLHFTWQTGDILGVDSVYQKSFKSVDFWLSFLKHKVDDFIGTQCIVPSSHF